MKHSCDLFPNEYKGKKVGEIPELKKILIEISTDYNKWTTLFRCKLCGQIWEEIYESKGHGEVPKVIKKRL